MCYRWFGGFFMLSRCFLEFSVGERYFVIGLSQICAFSPHGHFLFSCTPFCAYDIVSLAIRHTRLNYLAKRYLFNVMLENRRNHLLSLNIVASNQLRNHNQEWCVNFSDTDWSESDGCVPISWKLSGEIRSFRSYLLCSPRAYLANLHGELAMSLHDFSPWIPLGTFSILYICGLSRKFVENCHLTFLMKIKS